MFCTRLWTWVKNSVGSLSLEPVIFLFSIGMTVFYGPQVETDFQFKKVCEVELGHNMSTCDNLPAFPDVNTEVTDIVTTFQIRLGWAKSGLTLFFALTCGAFADKFGPKLILCAPLLGCVLESATYLLNYALHMSLPLEMLYLPKMLYHAFGGGAAYGLGMYTYGSLITTPQVTISSFSSVPMAVF